MPSVPKWLGDTMDAVFSNMYHPVTVTQVEFFNDKLKRVRFEGDLSGTKFVPGNVVEFRVTPTDYRHYTPSYYNATEGVCEVLFYLHDQGVGSEWARELQTGQTMKLLGPGGKLKYEPSFSNHFVFGDETALGLVACLQAAAETHSHSFFALIETETAHRDWIGLFPLIPSVYVASSIENPATAAIRFLEDSADDWKTEIQSSCYYLSGRAKSIQALRKYLLSKGVGMKQIKTEPYWAEGKKGL
ncbi:MAG: siderophore-interacting protein [Agriterribacter sp.]